jgi:hypothetical protein
VSRNPFEKNDSVLPASGTLSAEDQAEYNRLEALEDERQGEAEQAHPGQLPEVDESSYDVDAVALQVDDRDRDVPAELDQGDAEAEQAYPIQNAAVKWDDAANGGDTSREATATYNTPWGRRELSALEVRDLEHQGHTLHRVDDEPKTSREDEDAATRDAIVGTPLKHYDDEGFEINAKGQRV